MNACQISRPARISPLRIARPGTRSARQRQMISGTRNCETMFGWPPACEIMLGANVQNSAPTQAASREATKHAGEHQIPRDAGDCQGESEKYVERHMRAEHQSDRRHRQRNGQHRGVGHHVHPIGVIHAIGEERINAIREHACTVRQHPLKESLILWIIAQLMIKIEPQRHGDEERRRDETHNGERVSPGERAPETRPRGRLRLGSAAGMTEIGGAVTPVSRAISSASRSSASASAGASRGVPVSRLACRVNTRNRHSIGEPNRGW